MEPRTDESMRFAQIMLARRLGGAEQVFLDLCGALASRGHEVLAIGARQSEAMDTLDRRDDLQCLRVRCQGNYDRFCRWSIGRALRRFAPDIVQTHLGRASRLGGPAARAAGYPTLSILNNFPTLKNYRAINMLIPTTRDQEAYLEQNGVTAERFVRVPHFRSLAPVAEARVPRSTDRVVKSLGRFHPVKGFDVLLRAAALAERQGTCFRLELGGDGPERKALRALAWQLGIGGGVMFPGWIGDVAAFLSDADVFVLSSRSEPFGLVILEAMACGVPIVATRVSGPTEILDSKTAILVNPDDPVAIAAGVTAVFAEPDAAAERARTALRRFEQDYSEPAVIGRYLAACRRLVAASPHSQAKASTGG